MTRVPTYSSYMSMLNHTMKNKQQLDLYNFQAVTGLKSPTYAGYGMSAYSIVNMESSLGVTSNFLQTNKILQTEVKTMNTSLDAISKAINDFKSKMTTFSGMDLEDITPDYTGGEITFGSDTIADYEGKNLTVNGKTYTFVDGDNTGNNIDINGLTTGKEVMEALKTKLQATDAENFSEFKFEDNKFSFPFYTIDGESSVLDVSGVKTGEPHMINNDQYQSIKELQNMAFSALKMITDGLNSFANGKYLFGGGVSEKAPVDFPFKSLEEFQAYYDGINIKYPTNSGANLSNYSVNGMTTGDITLSSQGGNKGTITAQNGGSFLKPAITANSSTTGTLTFNSDKNTVNATEYGAFDTLNPGDSLVISDAGADHNGSYVIKSISSDGKTITFEDSTPIRADDQIVDGGGAKFATSFPIGSVIEMEGFDKNISPRVQVTGISADGTELYVSVDPDRWPSGANTQTINASSQWNLSCESYYKGGDLASEKRVSDNQSIMMDITAKDPAFEQMFRALGEIAQGNLVDTRNPLDGLNPPVDVNSALDRVSQAMDLIQDAIFSGGKNADKNNADLYTVQAKTNSNTVILNQVNTNLTLVEKNLADSIGSLKNVDKTEAAIKALLASTNLQASYSVLQNAMSISLLNYMK